ncbi:MAG: hypothetical protein KIS78_34600 [Labilithrix sp.]|nr:hypothetical protein [Labilithrix sp.]
MTALARFLAAARAASTAGALAGAARVGVAACRGSRTEGLDSGKLPESLRADYALFTQRCSKCHSLARPLAAGITDDEQWSLYVNRMRRQPGSGISYDDQERILRFLRWHAAELRRREAEKKPPPVPSASAPPPVTPAPAAPASTTSPAIEAAPGGKGRT